MDNLDEITAPLNIKLSANMPDLPVIPVHWKTLENDQGFQALFDQTDFFQLFPNATSEDVATTIDLIVEHLQSLDTNLTLPDIINNLIDTNQDANKNINVLALEISKDKYLNIALSFQSDGTQVSTLLNLEEHATSWMETEMKLGLAFTFK